MDEHKLREAFDAWFPYERGESINMVRDVAWDAWKQSAALSQPAAADGVLLPVAIYHHAAADGTFLPSESCVCEDDVYTNNGDDETIGVPLVRKSDAIAAVKAEQESCAKLCDLNAMLYHHQAVGGDNSGASDWKEDAAKECASDIRAKATA